MYLVKTMFLKDGQRHMLHMAYLIDTTKPKAWIEGTFYKFNTELIKMIRIPCPVKDWMALK
jgi:hypothetical protein